MVSITLYVISWLCAVNKRGIAIFPDLSRVSVQLPKFRCTTKRRQIVLFYKQSITMNRHLQNNLDAFKGTFQKPSQIYKFLGKTWKDNPLYLDRTLSYISKHRVQAVRKRAKIDELAKKLRQRASNGCRSNKDSNNSISNICYFNWICNDHDKTSQKTRSNGFICPWCGKNYRFLDSLIGHLKFSHPRFSFNLVEQDGQPVIEITLNSSFDASYCGFKYPGHDLRRDFKFTPKFPERRTPITQIIHFRTKKKIVYDDDEADVDVCSGRLYYHTSTCLPVKPNEVDSDSEADMDPDWLRERTQLMIDEFTDVNEGEKEILKLWNLHIMKNYKYKGDKMIRQACMDFVDLEGHYIQSQNLTRNFFLHLANLFDVGLLSSRDMLECIRMLQSKKAKKVFHASPLQREATLKFSRNKNP